MNLANARPGLAYRVDPGWLSPLQEAGDTPAAVLPHGLAGGVGQMTKRRPIDKVIWVKNATFLF